LNEERHVNSKPAYVNPPSVPELSGVLGQREPALVGHTTTVLLIEDDRAVSRAIVRLLRARGYHVLTAERGCDSLPIIDEYPDVDVVLIDIVLPDMTGTQVAALIHAKHPQLPIIFATAVGNVRELKGIEERRLLRKPFTEDELFDKVAAALNSD
jgi:CheY-like chemotaxis protein